MPAEIERKFLVTGDSPGMRITSSFLVKAILIGFIQIASFVALYETAFSTAAKLGREYRRSLGYGLMLHYACWIFAFAAFVVPISLVACRTRKPAIVSILCFLSMWSLLILPSVEEYPFRSLFLFLLGVIHVLAFGWIVSRYVRRVCPTKSATPAE